MKHYNKQIFDARYAYLGDTAEEAFDRVHPKHHKLGLNRPNFGLKGVDANIRYTPDRLLPSGFVEVMAIGHDNTLKIKHEKVAALKAWAKLANTELFVYHKPKNLYWQAPMSSWTRRLNLHGTDEAFNDGKTYIALHTDKFPGEPQEVPDGET